MTTGLSDLRQYRRNISTDISSQFPFHYAENGPLFVAFVEAYYEYLDIVEPSTREAIIIAYIDTTYSRFLDYFRNQYMSGLPKLGDADTRFIIKHIQDLYRRKGSEESLRLLFRMFFNEDIDVIYPAEFLLKPSDSNWRKSIFLEMRPVRKLTGYPILKGDRIKGSISGATAFVDQVVFRTLKGAIIPLLYISNNIGTFSKDDSLEVFRLGNNFSVGRLIYGSINDIKLDKQNLRPGNFQGKILNVRSSLDGTLGRCKVTKARGREKGDVEFELRDSGFGYTVPFNEDVNNTFTKVLAQPIAIGDMTIQIQTSMPITRFHAFKFSYSNQYYKAIRTAAPVLSNGVYTVTLDREIEEVWPAGTTVQVYNSNTINTVKLSNQVIVVDSTSGVQDIKFGDTVTIATTTIIPSDSINSTNDYSTLVASGTGEVIDYRHPLIYVRTKEVDAFSDIPLANPSIGESGGLMQVKNIRNNLEIGVFYCNSNSQYNNSAKFEVGEIDVKEEIQVIIDILGDFANKSLSLSNYGMTGSGQEKKTTKLADAFTPVPLSIGEIKNIKINDSGLGNIVDIVSDIRQEDVYKFIKGEMALRFRRFVNQWDENVTYSVGSIVEYLNSNYELIRNADAGTLPTDITYFKEFSLIRDQGFVLEIGDIIEQTYIIETLNADDPNTPEYETQREYVSKAEYVGRFGETFYFRPKTFYVFDPNEIVNINGAQYTISSYAEVLNGREMAANAEVIGPAKFSIGQIEEVEIIETGFRYRDDERVELVDPDTNLVVATAQLTVRGTGFTAGNHSSTTSFLNTNGKVIQDSNYYQDYAYDISSIINPNLYEKIVNDIVHPAGTKQFSSPFINSINDVRATADVDITSFSITETQFSIEQDSNTTLTTEVGEIYVAVESSQSEQITL